MTNFTRRIALPRLASILTVPLLAAAPLGLSQPGNADPKITVSAQDKNVPSELNPPFASPQSGGAPNATPAQAAAFAWQEFIALNWPAMPQSGKQGQRDSPSTTCLFADPSCTGPTVWETFRSKVEIFPAVGSPPGYAGSNTKNDLGMTRCPNTTTPKPSPRAIRSKRMTRHPGLTSMRPIRSPLPTCMRKTLRMTIRGPTVRHI